MKLKHYILAALSAVMLLGTGCETMQQINPLTREFTPTEKQILETIVAGTVVFVIENDDITPEGVLEIVNGSREGLIDGNVDLVNFKKLLETNGVNLNKVDPQYRIGLNLLLLRISMQANQEGLSEQKLVDLNDLLDWAEIATLQYQLEK